MTKTYIKYKSVDKNGDWELLEYTGDEDDVIVSELKEENAPITADLFAACPYKDLILGDSDPLAVAMTGSCALGAMNAYSDYDIVVYTKGEERRISKSRLLYKGRMAHWYYQIEGDWDSPDKLRILDNYSIGGLLEPCFDHVLWTGGSEEARAFVEENKGLQRSFISAAAGMCSAWWHKNGRLRWLIDHPQRMWGALGKCLWTRYYAAAVCNGEEPDVSLVTALKLARSQGISDGDAERIRATFSRYLSSHPMPTDASVAELEGKAADAWKAMWEAVR